MRPLDYLRTALRDIITQPVRCLLTVCTIIVSSALFVVLVSLGITARSAIVDRIASGDALSSIIVSSNSTVGSGLFSTSVQETRVGADKLDDAAVAKLRALPHVASAIPQVSVWELKNFQFEGSPSSFVASVTATSTDALSSDNLAAGTWFDNDAATEQVVLGNGYLRALGIKNPADAIGKTVTLTTIEGYRGAGADIPAWNADKSARDEFNRTRTTLTATIVGVTQPSANDNRLLIPLAWGQQIQTARSDTPRGEETQDSIAKNGFGSILVTADTQAAVASLAAAINELGFGTMTYQKQIDQVNQLAVILWIILGSIALISLISSSLGIINTLLMAVAEQRQTILIWRACGASRSTIANIYILQAVILSILGALAGVAIGAFAYLLVNRQIERVLAEQGLSGLALPPIDPRVLVGGVIISILLAVCASIYPAYVASRRVVK